jgi:potassium-transporting ATPase KdpC subunit
MLKATGIALRTTLVTLLLTGIAYPLLVYQVGKPLMGQRAEGSLVKNEQGRVVGSELIAQAFTKPGYFQPRPSAAGDKGFDATSSGGSNFGPTSKKLRDRVSGEVERLRKENPDAELPIPADLVTASGSGLDPHVSPQGALWQVPRIAKARQVSKERVLQVIQAHTDGPELGFLGERRVNVLVLNLALDQRFGSPH